MDTQQLLHPNNVDRDALQDYAREAADFSTNYRMPHLDFAVNHYGHPDVAMFDFTSMFAAENACRAQQVQGHRLLMGLVGDSLLEPFWPTGSGCARGFLSAFDAAWMMKSWASLGPSGNPLEVLAERESIYRFLAQTTPGNLGKDHTSYTLEPWSRYPTINTRAVLPFQVRQLYSTDDPDSVAAFLTSETSAVAPHLHVRHDDKEDLPRKRKRRDSLVDPDALLNWCQRQVSHLPELTIEDLATSFQDGLALCGILHRYRPELIPFAELSHQSSALNNQLAFDVLQSEYGVPSLMTGTEMAECEVPDRQSMICYLSRVHHALRGELPHIPHQQDAFDAIDEPPSLLPSRERGLTCRVLPEDSTFATSTLDKKSKRYRTERPLTEQVWPSQFMNA
ncbi:Calponin domain [Trinorchestia longiramus]|nr:Calponin domain [Trinorchestia longiramus]